MCEMKIKGMLCSYRNRTYLNRFFSRGGEHLEKKEAKMDTIEGSMKVAMALNYLREKLREHQRNSDRSERQPVLLLSIQIAGRALMIAGREVQIVGMRLVKFG